MSDGPTYIPTKKRLQHNISYNRHDPDDLALHSAIERYGSRDRNRHLLNAVNLYETLNNTRTDIGMQNAIALLRSDYANIVMELQDAETLKIDARLEALERNMADMVTKDDISTAVSEISNKLTMLATQDQVFDIQSEITHLNKLLRTAAHQLRELSQGQSSAVMDKDIIVTREYKQIMPTND